MRVVAVEYLIDNEVEIKYSTNNYSSCWWEDSI